MKKPIFTGTCTALVTPFGPGGIDFEVLDRLLDRQLAAGIEAVVVCGTTGEAATLEPEEKLALIAHAVRYVSGRCKVLAGTGGNHTAAAAALARRAADLGADGLLSVTPYYNRCTQAGLVAHYKTIAAASPLPILIYNVPSRTTVDIAPETCARLAALPNVVGIKEANPDVVRVFRLRQQCGGDFAVYCGNDDRIQPFLSAGAVGVVSVLSNLWPERVKTLADTCLAGRCAESAALQQELLPMVDALFSQVNPIPIKAALALAGLGAGECRLPLTPPTPALVERLQALMG